MAASWAVPPGLLRPSPGAGPALVRALPLWPHLAVGCLAYLAGYLAAPAGRGDLAAARPAGSAAGSRRGRRGEGGRMTDFTDRKTDAVTFRGKLGLPSTAGTG